MKWYIIAGFVVSLTYMICWKLNISSPIAEWIFSKTPRIFNTILGFGLMIWFITLTVFLFVMITQSSIRERSLKKIANIKDQDERENYISGKASRAAYLSSLSLMLFFLFYSVCGVSLNKFTHPAQNGGHKYSISMKFDYHIMNEAKANNPNFEKVFDTQALIPSTSTILLILIALQLLAYNFSIRREKR